MVLLGHILIPKQPVFRLISRCCMLRVEAKTQEDNIIVLLTGCFCIGPGIDSRLAVLAPRANTADRDSQFVTLLLNNLTGPYNRAV